MKAAVIHGVGQALTVETLDTPEPGPGEVLVKVAASGVCHTDMLFVEHEQPAGYPVEFPAVGGHEGAGTVAKVGPGVKMVRPGDHVILAVASYCGLCRYCRAGRPFLCPSNFIPQRRVLGRIGDASVSRLMIGTFGEYAVVPEQGAVKVRDDAPLDRLALLGCGVLTGVGAAINTAQVEVGSRVAVIGCGGVGLNVIQGARLAGAATIIGIDRIPMKLELAERLGANHVVNAAKEDPVARVQAITGDGVDYAFEVIGTVPTVLQALEMTCPGGTAVMVGVIPDPMEEIAVKNGIMLLERTLCSSMMGSSVPNRDIPKLVDLYMNGRLMLDELISHRRPIQEINEAFETLRAGEAARTLICY